MEISEARPDEIPQLCRLLGQLFAQEAEFTPDSSVQARALERIVSEPQSGTILVAREGGDPIGMVLLLYTVSTALGGRVALLEDMVVDRDQRGRGVGSRLLQHAIERAKVDGCLRITLLSDHDNASAHAFYRRYGFSHSPMVPYRLSIP